MGKGLPRKKNPTFPSAIIGAEIAQMNADGELFKFTEQKDGVLHQLQFVDVDQNRSLEESQLPQDRVGDARFHYCFFSWGYAFLQQAKNWDAPILLDNVFDDGTIRLKCEVGEPAQRVTLTLDLQEKHGSLLPVRFMRESDGHVSSMCEFLNYTLSQGIPIPEVVQQHSYPRKDSSNMLDLLGPRKTTFFLE